MRRFFEGVGRLIDRMSRLGVWIAAFLVAFLMVTQVAEVILRTLGHPTTWIYDVNLTALVGVIFLGLAGAEIHGEHVAVDFLTERIRGRRGQALRLVNALLTVAFLALLAWFGTEVALESIEQDRTTGGLFSIPAWIPESLLPIGSAMLALEILRLLPRTLAEPDPPHDIEGEPVATGGDIVQPPEFHR